MAINSKRPLRVLTELPSEFCSCPVEKLHALLGGPTLFHLQGENSNPIFVSVLLHGNEVSGALAIQGLLEKLKKRKLTRSILLFVGNTEAAQFKQRTLGHQVDFNRIWSLDGDSFEHQMAHEVLNYLERFKLFAAVDIHNNNGKNPFYACINDLDEKYIHLASLFSSNLVYFTKPDQVMSLAMAKKCPSVTLEAGNPGEHVQRVSQYLETLFLLQEIDTTANLPHISIFHTTCIMKFALGASLDFDNDPSSQSTFSLREDLEKYNFQTINDPFCLGHAKKLDDFIVSDMNNARVTEDYFKLEKGRLILKTASTPSMLHNKIQLIRQDCFGYLMEKLPISRINGKVKVDTSSLVL